VRTQLQSYGGSDPIWGFVTQLRTERFTGSAHVGSEPRLRLFAVDGRIYFAEREGDSPLGTRLVNFGVLSATQLERGSVHIGDLVSLARLFHRDPTIDRDAVELTIEMATEKLLENLALQPVGTVALYPLRHHPTGIHLWVRDLPSPAYDAIEPEPAQGPETAQEPEAAIEQAAELEPIAFAEPVTDEAPEPDFEPVAVVEAPAAIEPVAILEAPALVESPAVIEAPAVIEPVAGIEAPAVIEPVAALRPMTISAPLPTLDAMAVLDEIDATPDADFAEPEPAAEPVILTDPGITPAFERAMASLAEHDNDPDIAPDSDIPSLAGLQPMSLSSSLPPAQASEEEAPSADSPGLTPLPSLSSLQPLSLGEPALDSASEPAPTAEEVAPVVTDTWAARIAAAEQDLASRPESTPDAAPEPTVLPTLSALPTFAVQPAPPAPAESSLLGTLGSFGPRPSTEPANLAPLPTLASEPTAVAALAQRAAAADPSAPWAGPTHNLAAVEIWEMVDELVVEERPQVLVAAGGDGERRGKGWLRGRKG